LIESKISSKIKERRNEVLKLLNDKDLVKEDGHHHTNPLNQNIDENQVETDNNDADDDKIEWQIDGFAGRTLLNHTSNNGEEKEEGKLKNNKESLLDHHDDKIHIDDHETYVFDESDFIQEATVSFDQMGQGDDEDDGDAREEAHLSNSSQVVNHHRFTDHLPISSSTVSGSFSSSVVLPAVPTADDINQLKANHNKNTDDESFPVSPSSSDSSSSVSSEKEDDSSFHDEDDDQEEEEAEEEKEGYEDENDSLMSCDDELREEDEEDDSEIEKKEEGETDVDDVPVPIAATAPVIQEKKKEKVSLLPSLDEDLDIQLIGHPSSTTRKHHQNHDKPRSLKQDEMEFSNSFHLDDEDGDFVTSSGGKKKRPSNSEIAAREECIRKLKVLTTALKVI
jgi:hypothetical protein